MSKRVGSTQRVELVETHNIALSLRRLQDTPHDEDRWRRAVYHAICMSYSGSRETRVKLREALELP